MKKITVSVDDETHRQARIRAAELGTSVSAAVRDFPKSFAGEETDFDRRKRLQDDTIASIRSFRAGDRLTRDELHERDPTVSLKRSISSSPGSDSRCRRRRSPS